MYARQASWYKGLHHEPAKWNIEMFLHDSVVCELCIDFNQIQEKWFTKC